jgi:hypothetical protein
MQTVMSAAAGETIGLRFVGTMACSSADDAVTGGTDFTGV